MTIGGLNHNLLYLALLHILSLSVMRVYTPARVRPTAAPKAMERTPEVLL